MRCLLFCGLGWEGKKPVYLNVPCWLSVEVLRACLCVCMCVWMDHSDASCLLWRRLCCPVPPLLWAGQPLPSDPHLVDVLFDLPINVDDKLLSLWLPGRRSAWCAVPGPRLPPCLLLSPLAASSVLLPVARREQDMRLLLIVWFGLH